MSNLGTRSLSRAQNGRTPGGSDLQSYSNDPGRKKYLAGQSATFTAVDGKVNVGADTFTFFPTGDMILISGTQSNNGLFRIVGRYQTDTGLILDPPVKDEGPVSTNFRTP